MTGMATSCVLLWRSRYACGAMMRQAGKAVALNTSKHTKRAWSSCTTKLRDALKGWENCGVILLKMPTPPIVDGVGAVGTTGPKRVVAGPGPENKQPTKGDAQCPIYKHPQPQSNFGKKDRRIAYRNQKIHFP